MNICKVKPFIIFIIVAFAILLLFSCTSLLQRNGYTYLDLPDNSRISAENWFYTLVIVPQIVIAGSTKYLDLNIKDEIKPAYQDSLANYEAIINDMKITIERNSNYIDILIDSASVKMNYEPNFENYNDSSNAENYGNLDSSNINNIIASIPKSQNRTPYKAQTDYPGIHVDIELFFPDSCNLMDSKVLRDIRLLASIDSLYIKSAHWTSDSDLNKSHIEVRYNVRLFKKSIIVDSSIIVAKDCFIGHFNIAEMNIELDDLFSVPCP